MQETYFLSEFFSKRELEKYWEIEIERILFFCSENNSNQRVNRNLAGHALFV